MSDRDRRSTRSLEDAAPSRFSVGQRILLQTNAARDKAEALLQGLHRVQKESERYVADPEFRRSYDMQAGAFAVDRAIDSTRRIIGRLERAMTLSEQSLDDEAIIELEAAADELDRTPRIDDAFG